MAATALQQSPVQQMPAYPTPPAHRPTHAQPPESDFESLFRPADGQVNAHSLTQMIQPVEADYRMKSVSQGLVELQVNPPFQSLLAERRQSARERAARGEPVPVRVIERPFDRAPAHNAVRVSSREVRGAVSAARRVE